eukprot:CAMPEP_0201938996 /NCGR_PEP_ID=MMETSP0903-20130614/42344_1 /ASSEMBLY_ACC=CAM_ASM_000552 /TAXON_ID=420261 /ORGANISM="Thalassiosira antarctica, Strain CCMP982" /LENGTH=131 /DNA_ID=CAMNT_0048480391 /DNA_START=1 /DNA_END=392 /DNA_ORIENTATION=+
MDLFSPPPSSSLRTRPRIYEQLQPQHYQSSIVDLTATVTTSASVDEPHVESHHTHHETPEESHHPHHALQQQHSMEYAYESPPTIYTPHAVGEDGDTGRMAMSTSQKLQLQGLVVHVPKPRDNGESAPQGG